MSRRSWVGVVAVALAALVAVLWWTRGAAERGSALDRRALAPGVDRAPLVADGPVAHPPVAAADAEPASPDIQRAVPDPEDSVVLLAVEKETGLAVADADVWFGPRSLLNEHGAREPTDEEDVLRRHGRHARTDSRGESRLPAGEYSTVAVRKGELCGVRSYAAKAGEEVRVELEVQRSLAIQVVDGEGLPVAGVPVRIEARDPQSPAHPGHELWTGVTSGAEGLAVLHQFDSARIGRYAGNQVVDHTEGKWVVALLPFPLAEPVEAGFHPGELPTEPVRLVLPATGSLRIDLLDPEGELFVEGTWVHASLPAERLGQETHWLRRGAWYAREGTLLVPHVGVGLALRLDAHPREFDEARLDVLGPRAPGEEVRCALQLARRAFAVAGRALDARGEPLAARELQLELDADNGPLGRERLTAGGRTGADGRFRMQQPNLAGEALLHGLRIGTDPHAAEEVLFAEVSLQGRLASEGEIDLGDVRLAPAPIAAAGRVVDAEGAPVYWAMIEVFWEEEVRSGGELVTRRRYDYGLRAYSRLDGTFGIYGELEPRPWWIQVVKPPFVSSAPVAIRQGDEGLEIVLRRTGALEGVVLVDEGVPAELLEIEVRREGASARPHWRAGTHAPLPNGAFRIGDLEPGTVDLLVHLDQENGPVQEVRGILIETGGTSADARVAEIDLRGRVHAFHFEVTGDDGLPAVHALIGFRPATESGDMRRLVLLADGAGTFVSPWRAIDVEARAHGWRPHFLEGVLSGSRIRLRRGIPLVVRLAGELELPPEPLALRLALIPEPIYRKLGEREHTYSEDSRSRDGRRQWDRQLAGTFDASRELLLHLPGAGRYEYEWSLHTGPRHTTSIPLRGPSVLEVTDTTAAQVLDLSPEPEAYATQLRELARPVDR